MNAPHDYPPPFESPDVQHLAPLRPGSLPAVGTDPHGDDSSTAVSTPDYALPAAAAALQAAAARILAQGVPLADVSALADAARTYAADHAAETVARLNRSIGVRTPSLQSTKPIDAIRAVTLPLSPPTHPDDHEPVWVTALDGNDRPALDADGNTWTHCGVCGIPRPGGHEHVYGGDPLHPHVWTWTEDDGNGHMGHVCSCTAFRP
jgi:hypothetical protein